ncbi:uncharacterized protein JCM10292_005421 [Rhodotorula paludigena]|uniref:uncharacterized protein n=1 Tax=Rhodotorula paludigena TaxID=86838 RepID=UPI00317577AE
MSPTHSYDDKMLIAKDGLADATVYTDVERSTPDASASGEIDAVFGARQEKGPNYRAVGWISTAILLAKSQIGLGVLNIPANFATLGLGPGIILLLTVAAITTWSDYVIGIFKLNHPTVYSVPDCGELIAGPIGREVLAVTLWIFLNCVAGSSLLGISTALNAISLHATCTAVFVAVAAIVVIPLASMRTMGHVQWVGWVGMVSLVVSVLLVVIAIGAGGRPSPAPQEGPWDKDIVYWGNPTFGDAMSAIGSYIFALAGTPTFLPIASEMRGPKDFPKAVIACQSFVTAWYVAVGTAVYMLAGQYVASPALGTAGVLIKRIAYGLSLPGLVSVAVIYCHLSGKYLFVRLLRGSHHLNHPTATHWITWIACVLASVLFSYIIASAIPVFNGLVSLVGAMFGTPFCTSIISVLWFFDHWSLRHNPARNTLSYKIRFALQVFIFVAGIFITIGGSYGAIVDIIRTYGNSGGRAWSCADNSGSV